MIDTSKVQPSQQAGKIIEQLKELQAVYPSSASLRHASLIVHEFGVRMGWWAD